MIKLNKQNVFKLLNKYIKYKCKNYKKLWYGWLIKHKICKKKTINLQEIKDNQIEKFKEENC